MRRYCRLCPDHSAGRLRIAPNSTCEGEPDGSRPHFRGRLRRHCIYGRRTAGLGSNRFCKANAVAGAVGFGTPNTAVAFLFSTVLVAGSGPRVDGTYNKVAWIAKGDYPSGDSNIAVEARPLGESQPVPSNSGGADVVDLLKPGCWTFRLAWTAHSQPQVSAVNLDVLPAGTRP
jgi:hypothetical protein